MWIDIYLRLIERKALISNYHAESRRTGVFDANRNISLPLRKKLSFIFSADNITVCVSVEYITLMCNSYLYIVFKYSFLQLLSFFFLKEIYYTCRWVV